MRKRKAAKAACFMAAAMVAGSLAGCGQKAAPETTAAPTKAETMAEKKEETTTAAPAEKPAEQVELKVFGFKTGEEEGAIPALIEQFNQENPDIKVVYEGISNAGGYQDVPVSYTHLDVYKRQHYGRHHLFGEAPVVCAP